MRWSWRGPRRTDVSAPAAQRSVGPAIVSSPIPNMCKGDELMRMKPLWIGVVAACFGLSAAAPQQPKGGKPIDLRRGLDLALTAVRGEPERWATDRGVTIMARQEKGEWSFLFDQTGGPVGSHVLVVVKPNGTAEVHPGM